MAFENSSRYPEWPKVADAVLEAHDWMLRMERRDHGVCRSRGIGHPEGALSLYALTPYEMVRDREKGDDFLIVGKMSCCFCCC